MIFYKKKSWIQKIIQKLSRIFKNNSNKDGCGDFKFFGFLRGVFVTLSLFVAILYVLYLFLIPILVKEDVIEKYINENISKNTTFKVDIEDIKIYSGYKFNINLKAKKFDIKYPNNTIFISLNKLNTDINVINLILKKPASVSIKAKDVNVNLNFKKKYDFIDCLKPEFFNSLEKIQTDTFKFSFDNFNLALNDKNIKKTFFVKITSPKIVKNKDTFEFYSKVGKIYSNKTILDFSVKVSYLLKDNSIQQLKNKLLAFNYNPFLYADKYNFYAKSNIDLKISTLNKKNNIQGKLYLDDCTFSAYNIKLPKNSFMLDFKGDKIFLNCDFNLIKNQFIKINSKIDISKNKFIEANIKSNDIDLKDLSIVLKTLLKIIKPDFNFENYELTGNLKADLYLKSNFKTLKSSGILNISNSSFKSKNPNLLIDKINSNINFSNDKINIIDTSCYFDKAKFYIKGNIDTNSNLNIDINSQKLPISTMLDISKKFISNSDLKDFDFNKGNLKIKSNIKGNLKNPLIALTGTIDDFKIYLKKYKTNVSILKVDFSCYPKLDKMSDIGVIVKNVTCLNKDFKISSDDIKLNLNQDDITILNSKFNLINPYINLNNLDIKGTIKNYKKDSSIDLNLKGYIKSKNKYLIINPKTDKHLFVGTINIKDDKLSILKADIFNNGIKAVEIMGAIDKLSSNNPLIEDIKVALLQKANIHLLNPNDAIFNAIGTFNISNSFKNPKIDGNFDLSSLYLKQYGIFAQDVKLNIKDSILNINLLRGKIADMDFSLLSNVKILNNGIIINNVSIASDYINYASIEKYLKYNLNQGFDFEILNLKGVISKFLVDDITLSSFYFEGDYKNNVLNISKYQADIFNGKIQGDLTCNLKNLKVKLNSILKGINVRYFSNRLKQYSIAISGNLSALVDVNFIYSDTDTILKTLDGYIKFNIDDGELNHFAKLERFLHAGNILSHSILKLSLNSIVSTLTKHNTGYFKTIEGTIKIKNSIADIQYIKTQGTAMSMYLKGNYNLLNQNVSLKVLGIIPSEIVNVMGAIGKVSGLSNEASLESHIDDIKKIPSLVNSIKGIPTRIFSVIISGDITKTNSIKVFRWIN